MGAILLNVAALLLAASSLATASVAAQATTGTLAGRVADETGRPLPVRAKVVVRGRDGGSTRTAYVQGKGQFRVDLLRPGSYTIDATAEGYQPATVGPVEVVIGRTVTVDVTLTRVAAPVVTRAAAPEPDAELASHAEREVRGGQTAAFRVRLGAGQCLRLSIAPADLRVVVRVYDPNRDRRGAVDVPSYSHARRGVLVVADVAGDYRIEVTSLERGAAPRRLAVAVERNAAATERDAAAARAVAAFADASRSAARRDAGSLRVAADRYREAAGLFHAAGEPDAEAAALGAAGEVYLELGDAETAARLAREASAAGAAPR
jgi:hypothetical protein